MSDLNLNEHIKFQKKFWIFQRIMWIAFIGIVTSGILGLFGEGILSQSKLTIKNSVIEYEYFARYQSPTSIIIRSSNLTNSSVSFDQKLLGEYQIIDILPPPKNVEIKKNYYNYIFDVKEPTNTHIIFYLEPQKHGYLSGQINIGVDQYQLKQFIYP